MSNFIRFADISGNNSLSPSDVKASIGAVMIKATEGTSYVSSACDHDYQDAKKSGLLLGFYHYARNNDASQEAQWFYDNCKNYFGEAVPCLDWEEGQSVDWVNSFVKKVHDLSGVWPWVYASSSTFNSNQGVDENCGRWVAAWPNGVTTFDKAESYGVRDLVPGLDCAWQFTSSGRLSGYSGNLDLNLFYGSSDAWKAYAEGDGAKASEEVKTVLENEKYKVTIEEK